MFRSGKGQSAARRLAALPSDSYVRLRTGAVFAKAVTRWLPAGWIPVAPTTSKALARLNGNIFPTVMVAAAGTRHRDTW